jgi:regulator of protease activity HflC (stomatin/prohibitin superfamily)
VKRIINFVSLAVIVIFLLPGMCFDRIEPGFIGVRRSLEGGVAEEDFHAGYHVSLPLWHSWYQIDGTLYYLEFTEDNNSALDVRTKDNNIIFIDVAIPYRIQDGKAWMIVREGFADSYEDKAKSTAAGVLREQLAAFSNIDVQKPEVRQQAADGALPALNKALEQYHLVATHVVIRSIRFRQQYEDQLQNKQFFIVQGRLDEARQRESVARQETDTLEKTIEKDIAVKREEWNKKIEELKSTYQLQISGVEAETTRYTRNRRADADAAFAQLKAEGDLAETQAEALGQRLRAEALATKAGRTFSAIEAVRRFKLGNITLNSSDPKFLRDFGSMKAWRDFFLTE